MPFKILLIIFASINSYGAKSSIEKKYFCNKAADYSGTKAKLCSHKKNYKMGLRYADKEKWFIDPVYTNISMVSGNFYLQKKNNGHFVRWDSNLKNSEKTDYVNLFSASKNGNGIVSGTSFIFNIGAFKFFQTDNGEITLIPKNSKSFSESKRIKNVDTVPYVDENGETIHPVNAGLYSGVIVRHRKNDKLYYAIYNDDSKLLKDNIPEENIKFWYNAAYAKNMIGYFIPMLLVDKDRDIYWPLIWDKFGAMNKPKNLLGLLNNSYKQWVEPKQSIVLNNQSPRKMMFWNEAIALFKGKDQDNLIARADINIKKETTFTELVQFFYTLESKAKATEYFKIDSIYIASNGEIYDETYWVFADQNSYKVDKYNLHQKFSNKDELLGFFEALEDKRLYLSDLSKKNYDNERQNIARMRQDADQKMEAYFQDMKDKKAEAKARKRAVLKAASDQAWQGVSNQLQNRAAEADAKANCLRKQTQTKKDFLSGKQNWYQTGGCR